MLSGKRILTTFTLAVYAAATPDLSPWLSARAPDCASAIQDVVRDTKLAQCLSPTTLVIPLLFTTDISSSIIPTLSQWLGTICSADACSSDDLNGAFNTIIDACEGDIKTLTKGNFVSLASIRDAVVSLYPTARNAACLMESNSNCLVQSLTALQSNMGQQISVQNIWNTAKPIFTGISNGDGLQFDFDKAPSSLICTNCVKATWTTLNSNTLINGLLGPSSVTDALRDKCGASFTDRSMPVGIVSLQSTDQSIGKKGGAVGSIGDLNKVLLLSIALIISSVFSISL